MTLGVSFSTSPGISVSVPLMVPLVSCDAYSMALHDQKSHVAPYFDCPDLRNAMMPLLTSSASPDANARMPVLMSSHNENSHCAPHFDCLDIWDVMGPFSVPSTTCDAHAHANDVT